MDGFDKEEHKQKAKWVLCRLGDTELLERELGQYKDQVKVLSPKGAALQEEIPSLAKKILALDEKKEPTDEEKAKWILNYTRAMQQETAELIDSVPWKWWAKYQKFDEQNAKVEVVDLFHFLVSLAQTLGMTADDVYQAYLKKNQVNHQRQDSGYAKKDEADSKHI